MVRLVVQFGESGTHRVQEAAAPSADLHIADEATSWALMGLEASRGISEEARKGQDAGGAVGVLPRAALAGAITCRELGVWKRLSKGYGTGSVYFIRGEAQVT